MNRCKKGVILVLLVLTLVSFVSAFQETDIECVEDFDCEVFFEEEGLCDFDTHTSLCGANGWTESNGIYFNPAGEILGDDVSLTASCCCNYPDGIYCNCENDWEDNPGGDYCDCDGNEEDECGECGGTAFLNVNAPLTSENSAILVDTTYPEDIRLAR